MKHRENPIAGAVPQEWFKVEHNVGARQDSGNCTESSIDLLAGPEVVELPAPKHWPETMPFKIELPGPGI
jgi:hypothetical protein